jgi:pimeloyl-ACP methyl ester carboxylesterase
VARAADSGELKTVRSKDGTQIAFNRVGRGPALILVDPALCDLAMGQSRKLAELLAPHFTVFTYDRRGRGSSGDRQPYAIEREIEDIEALLSAAGGTAFVWGMSSGAVLALAAANRLSGIKKLVVFEAPLIVDDSRPSTQNDWAQINDAIAQGRRGDAVKLFMKSAGVPAFARALLPLMRPLWRKLEAIAHTLPYDGAIVAEYQKGVPLPLRDWMSVQIPTLVTDGGKSPAWMRNANRSLAGALINAQYRTLEGQTHLLRPKAHAPVLIEFFRS